MTNPMTTIPITIPRRFRSYQREVILYGHEPGTLSGSGLTGKARQYAARYKVSREAVEAYVEHEHGVSSMVVRPPDMPRASRVWVDVHGRRVQFVEA